MTVTEFMHRIITRKKSMTGQIHTVIIIPARYASTRFPGKPLAMIAGRTMLERVVAIAQKSVEKMGSEVQVLVTSDDGRIAEHCDQLGVMCVMTNAACPSGTDRVAEAIQQLPDSVDFIINFQGDAPLTPPHFIRAMIESYKNRPCDVVTPVVQLDWPALDALRDSKQVTPFSGTCASFVPDSGQALWFSKTILPAIRKEQELRKQQSMSPVYRHIGLYGYARDALQRFQQLPEGYYEALEGLEQLRMLEHGMHIRCVPVSYEGREGMSGVDSPEDVARAEALIAKYGELA